ncbi:MAG: translation elongation factor Ts [Armatimonadetes bacterium]|nr:translation elongation factor Ts [Armatimonadota bacterium]
MAEITAAMVKELRDKTQAGMMEAKKALTDADGDMDAAIRALREKHKNMQVKEGRTSAEGVVEAFVREHNRLGVLVEINSETDFVARNEEFIALARDMARHAAENPQAASVDELLDATHTETGQPARLRVQEVFGKMRENIIFKRFAAFRTEDGTVDAYVHKTGGAGGKIGVLIELAGEGEAVKELAHEVAMHIASARPKYLRREDVPESVVSEEREIVRTRTMADPKNASKPANILDKIIEGGVGTFYKEQVLLEQPYVREPKQTIAQLIQGKAEIRRFVRFEVGEAAA